MLGIFKNDNYEIYNPNKVKKFYKTIMGLIQRKKKDELLSLINTADIKYINKTLALQDHERMTPLYSAVSDNLDPSCFQALLDKAGQDVINEGLKKSRMLPFRSYTSFTYDTPFTKAATRRNLHFKMLLEKANTNTVNEALVNSKFNIFSSVARNQDNIIVKNFLEKVDATVISKECSKNVLETLIRSQQKKASCITYLLNKVDIKIVQSAWDCEKNHEDYGEMTFLHIVAKYGDRSRFKSFLNQANKESAINYLNTALPKQDKVGLTALHLVAIYQDSTAFIALFEKVDKSSIEVAFAKQTTGGWTALHVAACSQNLQGFNALISEVTPRLIREKIGLKTTNNGHTPLHLAVRENRFGIVKQLYELGSDIYTTDHKNNTPLSDAKKYGYTEIVEFLENPPLQKQVTPELAKEEFSRMQHRLQEQDAILEKERSQRLDLEQQLQDQREYMKEQFDNLTLEQRAIQEKIVTYECAIVNSDWRQLAESAEEELIDVEDIEEIFDEQVDRQSEQTSEHKLEQQAEIKRIITTLDELSEQVKQVDAAQIETELSDIKSNIDLLGEGQAQLLTAYQEKQKVLQEKNAILEEPLLEKFYKQFQLKLIELLTAYKVASTGLFQRETGKKGTAVEGVAAIANPAINIAGSLIPIPGVGIIAKIIASTITTGAKVAETVHEKKIERTDRQIVSLFENIQVMNEQVEEAARALTLIYQDQIEQLTEKGSKTLADCAMHRIIEALRARKIQKDEPFPQFCIRTIATLRANEGLLPLADKDISAKLGTRIKGCTDENIFQDTGLKVSAENEAESKKYYHASKKGSKFCTKPQRYGYRKAIPAHVAMIRNIGIELEERDEPLGLRRRLSSTAEILEMQPLLPENEVDEAVKRDEKKPLETVQRHLLWATEEVSKATAETEKLRTELELEKQKRVRVEEQMQDYAVLFEQMQRRLEDLELQHGAKKSEKNIAMQ